MTINTNSITTTGDTVVENQKLKKETDIETKQKTQQLFAFMNENQAASLGQEMLDEFHTCDINKDKTISAEELLAYESKNFVNTNISTNDKLKNFSNMSTEKQIETLITTAAEEYGIKEQLNKLISEVKDSDKQDINSYMLEKFGVDLSNCKSDEEKKKLIVETLNNKYSTTASEEDYVAVMNSDDNKYTNNVYLTHYKRIKNGDFTKQEQTLKDFGVENLTEEQIRKYAKIATEAGQGFEVINMFAKTKNSDKKLLASTLSSFNKTTQTMAWGAAIISMPDGEAKSELVKKFVNDNKAVIDAHTETGQLATLVLAENAPIEESIIATGIKGKFGSDYGSLIAFQIIDVAERNKVAKGQITQEEYDKNYVNVYAANAHKLELASQAYSYVMQNTNDTNRAATMNTLASNAYQIKNENERNSAISTIKSSQYYNENVQNNLNNSYIKSLEIAYQSDNNVQKTQETKYNNVFVENISQKLIKEDEAEQLEAISETISYIDDKSPMSISEKVKRYQSGSQILNMLVTDTSVELTPSAELKMIAKLKGISNQTLLGLFLNCNSKTKQYLYKNNIIPVHAIAWNTSEADKKNLPEKIKIDVENFINNSNRTKV